MAKAAARKAPSTTPKKRSSGPKAKTFRALTPDDFAPFSEDELMELARRVSDVEEDARSQVLTQHAAGATLLGVCGAVDDVLKPLIAVWGPDGLVAKQVA